MITVQLLESTDEISREDWCRPLYLSTVGYGDEYSFRSMCGTPENNVKWVKVKHVLSDIWFGKTVAEARAKGGLQYEFLRGDLPRAHALNMTGYEKMNTRIKKTHIDDDWL